MRKDIHRIPPMELFRALMLLTGLLHVAFSPASAQDTVHSGKSYFIPGIRLNYGLIIPHSTELKEAANAYPIGLQADFTWHYNTQKAFNYCNCLPRLGFSVYFWDYRNEDILGEGLSLMFFAEPVFNTDRRFNFSLRPAMGLAYLNSPYDSISNPYNVAYSTRIVYSLLLNFSIYYNVSDRLLLNAAINYNHVSNGGVKLPNKGLNFPTISIGMDYSIRPRHFKQFQAGKELQEFRRNRFLMAGFVGFKGSFEDDKTYPVYGLTGKFQYGLSGRSYLAGGLELNIDQTKALLSERYSGVDKNDRYIAALTGGYEYRIGHFSVLFDLGVYVRNPDLVRDVVFQRYGAKFFPWRNLFTGISLRAHRHHAEFFDVRVGYVW